MIPMINKLMLYTKLAISFLITKNSKLVPKTYSIFKLSRSFLFLVIFSNKKWFSL